MVCREKWQRGHTIQEVASGTMKLLHASGPISSRQCMTVALWASEAWHKPKHLVVNDAVGLGDRVVSSHSIIKEVIVSGSRILVHFNRSVKGNKLVVEKQKIAGIPHHSFLHLCYAERLLEQERALHKVVRLADIWQVHSGT